MKRETAYCWFAFIGFYVWIVWSLIIQIRVEDQILSDWEFISLYAKPFLFAALPSIMFYILYLNLKRKINLAYRNEFIINNFFKCDYYAGWKNIATDLVTSDTNTSNVAGPIVWTGGIDKGIGNFIDIEPIRGASGVFKYTFNLKEFLTSNLYKNKKKELLGELSIEKLRIEEEYKMLRNI